MLDFPATPGRALEPVLTAAGAGDLDFLFQLYASTRLEEVSSFGWDERQLAGFMRMQFTARERAYASAYSGAERSLILYDGQRVGAIIVQRQEREIRLIDIALLPEARSRGIGTVLIVDLIRECRRANKPLRLQVAKSNRAGSLYRRLGFIKTGEDAMYDQMEFAPLTGDESKPNSLEAQFGRTTDP
ncbi:MAG TPA: GNAT family N-acetyltransferase [Terriglobales bacterium]|nr:GNAT family N-acetyltransferase [Terriglobales bacterium]